MKKDSSVFIGAVLFLLSVFMSGFNSSAYRVPFHNRCKKWYNKIGTNVLIFCGSLTSLFSLNDEYDYRQA